MEKIPTIAILMLALLTAPAIAGGALAEPNDEQAGRTGYCDVWLEDEAAFHPALAPTHRHTNGSVEVGPGTDYVVSAEDGSDVTLRFFDDEGDEVAHLFGDGTVPSGATWGLVCVHSSPLPPFGWTASNPTTTWHYQDGF